jgi:hypothetical protein
VAHRSKLARPLRVINAVNRQALVFQGIQPAVRNLESECAGGAGNLPEQKRTAIVFARIGIDNEMLWGVLGLLSLSRTADRQHAQTEKWQQAEPVHHGEESVSEKIVTVSRLNGSAEKIRRSDATRQNAQTGSQASPQTVQNR